MGSDVRGHVWAPCASPGHRKYCHSQRTSGGICHELRPGGARVPAADYHGDMHEHTSWLASLNASVRGFGRAVVFLFKLFPMLPSRPVDWVTAAPVIERVKYPRQGGEAEGDIYRPSTKGPHPAVVVCLGVVPFEFDHPQVPVLGRALARAGFVALLYWSPAMRNFRLDPEDVDNLALAYRWLTDQAYVDPARSGLLGTCVGGSFALMSATHATIRDRVAFAAAYAPFSSMWTLARDIASAARTEGDRHEPWRVDQLTRKVFVHSLTAMLEPAEAEALRAAYAVAGGMWDGRDLSADGEAIRSLMTASGHEAADAALHRLPAALQERLTALSPMNHLKDLEAPLIVLLHDAGDQVVPVGESRRLVAALIGRGGVHYTEMHFSHLDPSKGRLPLLTLLREFSRFFRAMFPLFRQSVAR